MIVRTASGPVECTPLVRTTSGLVECADAMFRGVSGVVSIGSEKPLSASAAPTYCYGATEQRGSANVITNGTFVSVQGGKAPYSFAWTRQGSSTLIADYPASANTSFSGNVGANQDITDTFVCKVTDAKGKFVLTNVVTATVSNYGGSGGNL